MRKETCFLFLLLLQLAAASHSTVKFLPGFQGPLPFELETGYIGVGNSEDVQLFYYFVKSQGNPKEDPLLLWLTGGPGCSAFSGFVYEIGPMHFHVVEYNGSLPTLVLNPHTWTKVSSIIFVDMPVGTGFSYATTQLASQSSDTIQVQQADQFLRKWLKDHPEFLLNPAYIGGDSYSGLIVPPTVKHISNGNEEGIEPLINLKGYLVGNPVTDKVVEGNSQIVFAHRTGLLSEELYASLKKSCGGEYQSVDPSNVQCLAYLQDYYKCISGIYEAHILEPLCPFASPKPMENFSKRRFLDEKSRESLEFQQPPLPTIGCRSYGVLLSAYWANDDSVRKALHIREGSTGNWKRCNFGLPYAKDISSSTKYHASLGAKGYRALVYRSIIDDWRPWYVEGQVAGYTRTYSDGMTYATVKGGGHTAPEYKPPECFAMFKRWIVQEPL